MAEDFALDGGETPEDMHMTVVYVPNVSLDDTAHALKVVEQYAKQSAPLTGEISGVGRFYASGTSDGMDVIYASFDGPTLPAFRQGLIDRLSAVGVVPSTAHGYSPHITLAYIDQETSAEMTHSNSIPVTFESIQLRVGDEVVGEFPMKGETPVQKSFDIPIQVHKMDEDEHLVFGWLSVSEDERGNLIVDAHDDIITPDDLEQMAYDFVLYARMAGEMHERMNVGRLVESMAFTKEKQQALGIPLGILPIGWWVGFYIDDPDVWEKVKSGEYAAFSFGGYAYREEVS